MYDQVVQNKRRSAVLVLAFVVFTALVLIAIAYGLGLGSWGIAIAVVLATGGALAAYWKSDAIALATSRARPADPIEFARLHNLVEGLCIASGLPKPRVYVIDDPAPNAFATGRNPAHAAIAVTTGLLQKMNRVELEGVVAHELSHVKNYDTLVATLAVIMVGVVTLIADLTWRFHWLSGHRRDNDNRNAGPGALLAVVGIVLLIVGPIVARLMHLAISRRRESLADLSAVEMTRYPPGLISALEKLQGDNTVVRSGSRATAHMWIEDPLAKEPEEGNWARLNRLFNTHPPLEERIAALREL
ncbi:MAG: heat shock protein HtpX [Acidimicrobiia bacterium]|jgi:heat shock protein HtpX|nr:heat shock protein HtpX [Acidimicrobiia bacterium]